MPNYFILLYCTIVLFNIAQYGCSEVALEKECPGLKRECVRKYFAHLPLAKRAPIKVFNNKSFFFTKYVTFACSCLF